MMMVLNKMFYLMTRSERSFDRFPKLLLIDPFFFETIKFLLILSLILFYVDDEKSIYAGAKNK